jgi:hypothetical protein
MYIEKRQFHFKSQFYMYKVDTNNLQFRIFLCSSKLL